MKKEKIEDLISELIQIRKNIGVAFNALTDIGDIELETKFKSADIKKKYITELKEVLEVMHVIQIESLMEEAVDKISEHIEKLEK